MSQDEHETVVIARKLRYDLTAMQAKVTDLLNALGRLDLPSGSGLTCPECGPFPGGPAALAEHRYVSHEGPVPEHWKTAEERADTPFLVYDRESNNVLAEFETRAEAEAALGDWPGCEVAETIEVGVDGTERSAA